MPGGATFLTCPHHSQPDKRLHMKSVRLRTLQQLLQQRRACVHTAMATQKAVVFQKHGGLEVLEYTDVPKPTAGPGELLVKNEYIGVNFIDTYHRSGLYPRTQFPGGLGEEGAGTVAEVGEGVEGFQVGDRVAYLTRSAAAPSYAEYTAAKAANTTKLPDGLGADVGASLLTQGLTALTQVTDVVQVKKGDWVLVHAAAGGTGQILVQLATYFGANVIGTTSTPEKAELAKRLGAKEVILYNQEDVVQRVLEITDGQGVDIVYDGVGKATIDASLAVLKNLGWLVVFGNASGKPDPFDILRLSPKSIRLTRPSLFATLGAKGPNATQEAIAQLLQLVADGVVKTEIHKVYSLSAAAEAQSDLVGRKTTGKLLLRPDSLSTAKA